MLRLATPEAAARWLTPRVSGSLRCDSRTVRTGDGFLAWAGHTTDGRRHVAAAMAAGATACLLDDSDVDASDTDDSRVAALADLKSLAGPVADAFYGAPSHQLDVLAVTGTNGKTSTVWWLAQVLNTLGRRCAAVGTLGALVPSAAGALRLRGHASQAGTLTTPDAVSLQTLLRQCVDAGLQAVALEASSIGLAEHRLRATRIKVALFTNFTQDHLDYHGSMGAYWSAKRALFAWPGLHAAVVNIDDTLGAALAIELQGSGLDVWTVSCTGPARLSAQNLRYDARGLCFDVHQGPQCLGVHTGLVGDYNASNLLGVLAALGALGLPLTDTTAALAHLTPVPGRLQRVPGRDASVDVLVDYAHTPDALEKTLQTLRRLAQTRGGQLVCVFGCGGNRDASKRPLMGAIAERLADRVVLTSDNPRWEDPHSILLQVQAGLTWPRSAVVIEDRRAAIEHAVLSAQRGDVVLLAGKGHEAEQEVAGVRLPFSDVAEATIALARRLGQAA